MSRYADIAVALANAQAESTRRGGEIWGSTLSRIGEGIAAIPAQIQQQKHQDALMLLEQAKEARARGEEERANALLAQSQAVHVATQRIVGKAIKPDGTWDPAASIAEGQAAGMPDVALELNQKYKPKPVFHPAGSVGFDEAGQPIPGAVAPPIPRQPTEASLATDLSSPDPAVQQRAKTALDALRGQKNPPSLEEQLLTAIAAGDTAKATQIKTTLRTTADARRDPAAASLANELGNLRADEARQRLADLQAAREPLDIDADIQTTTAGRKYIDLSLYQGKERNRARTAAGTAGATAVSKEQANALQEIDNARANQKSINDQIQDLLPRGVGGRILAVPTVKLEKLFQTDERVAAFNSWRTAAIQTLRATAGSKGLRINQAEIAQAIENDIPKLTDTLGTAQQKLKNIETMLENAEKSILVRDRAVTPVAAPGSTTPATPVLNPRVPRR